MKKVNLILATIIGLLIITSCSKDENPDLTKIVGTYNGTLTINSNKVSIPAIAEISENGNDRISIHCYSDSLDTTFVMDVYQESNMIYCNHSNESDNKMMKMNHCNNNSSEHFGEFDTNNNSFSYVFKTNNQSKNFSGTKK